MSLHLTSAVRGEITARGRTTFRFPSFRAGYWRMTIDNVLSQSWPRRRNHIAGTTGITAMCVAHVRAATSRSEKSIRNFSIQTGISSRIYKNFMDSKIRIGKNLDGMKTLEREESLDLRAQESWCLYFIKNTDKKKTRWN